MFVNYFGIVIKRFFICVRVSHVGWGEARTPTHSVDVDNCWGSHTHPNLRQFRTVGGELKELTPKGARLSAYAALNRPTLIKNADVQNRTRRFCRTEVLIGPPDPQTKKSLAIAQCSGVYHLGKDCGLLHCRPSLRDRRQKTPTSKIVYLHGWRVCSSNVWNIACPGDFVELEVLIKPPDPQTKKPRISEIVSYRASGRIAAYFPVGRPCGTVGKKRRRPKSLPAILSN